MQVPFLILFSSARPFEPFRAFLADGRQVEVRHPETIILTEHAAELWLLHLGGQVEIIDTGLITSLQTIGNVDPIAFIGPANL